VPPGGAAPARRRSPAGAEPSRSGQRSAEAGLPRPPPGGRRAADTAGIARCWRSARRASWISERAGDDLARLAGQIDGRLSVVAPRVGTDDRMVRDPDGARPGEGTAGGPGPSSAVDRDGKHRYSPRDGEAKRAGPEGVDGSVRRATSLGKDHQG